MNAGNSWLAGLPDADMWSALGSTEFRGIRKSANHVVILPVLGLADWGLGRPLDIEETLGTAVLHMATGTEDTPTLILPPLRQVHAPYPHTAFGVDFETTIDLMAQIAGGVKEAGFSRLLLFTTSPWNEQLTDIAGRQIRAKLGLQVFLTSLAALGLDLHPVRSTTREAAQCAACACLGTLPATQTTRGKTTLPDFRPGNVQQPSPLVFRRSLSAAIKAGTGYLQDAAKQFAGLLHEMHRTPPPGVRRRTGKTRGARTVAPLAPPRPFPAFRDRYLPAKTPAQIKAIARKREAVVIVPTAAIEQHGPHLPVGVDAIIGQACLAGALAHLPAKTPVYVGPPIIYGMSDEHRGFPGTISLSPGLFHRVLMATARQVRELGFGTMAVYNTHGGNSPAIVATLREIQTKLGINAGMIAPAWKPPVGAEEAAFGIHAGQVETALMLAAAPHLVRMKQAVSEFPARLDDPGELRPEGAAATMAWITEDISKSGTMGDATKATAPQGRAWLDASARSLAESILQLLSDIRGL